MMQVFKRNFVEQDKHPAMLLLCWQGASGSLVANTRQEMIVEAQTQQQWCTGLCDQAAKVVESCCRRRAVGAWRVDPGDGTESLQQ